MPLTSTRRDRFVVVPSPSWPWTLFPQHHSAPLACRAQVWLSPAARATTLVKLLTGAGLSLPAVVPSPTCPAMLRPQQNGLLSDRSAQVWCPPATTATAGESRASLTATGLSRRTVVLSPN